MVHTALACVRTSQHTTLVVIKTFLILWKHSKIKTHLWACNKWWKNITGCFINMQEGIFSFGWSFGAADCTFSNSTACEQASTHVKENSRCCESLGYIIKATIRLLRGCTERHLQNTHTAQPQLQLLCHEQPSTDPAPAICPDHRTENGADSQPCSCQYVLVLQGPPGLPAEPPCSLKHNSVLMPAAQTKSNPTIFALHCVS